MKRTRRVVQLGFLLLTVIAVYVMGANAERWCPFGGVEAIYTYVNEGNMPCSLAVSNFYLLAGVLVITLLLRRAFCGYMCPIGAASEFLRGGSRRVGIKEVKVHPKVDHWLSMLKYPVLALILYFTYRLSELIFRGFDPCYALISRHGEDITFWAYIVAGAIVIASLLITMPFCRWLCPLGAVLNLFSWIGLTRVKRDTDSCLECKLCDKACPMGIPVSQKKSVLSARCISCLSCVEACPTRANGALRWGPPDALGRSWHQGVLIGVLVVCLTAVVVASYAFPLPSFVRQREIELPAETAAVEMQLEGLTCRGRGSLLWYFLDRDDFLAVEGYLQLDAWPGPGLAQINVIYDPQLTDESALKMAISDPYFDAIENMWRPSPFLIEGYDPYAIE